MADTCHYGKYVEESFNVIPAKAGQCMKVLSYVIFNSDNSIKKSRSIRRGSSFFRYSGEGL
jgi:hypothetical protein